MASVTALNESHDDYPRVVANLNERWRVVECRDRGQWVLQWRSGGPETCRSDTWRGRGYFRTSEALKRAVREQRLSVDHDAERVISALPDWLDGIIGPIPALRYGRRTRLLNSSRLAGCPAFAGQSNCRALRTAPGRKNPCPTHAAPGQPIPRPNVRGQFPMPYRSASRASVSKQISCRNENLHTEA